MSAGKQLAFNLNHLLFNIWSYIEFPALLPYSAVCSFWCRRLWVESKEIPSRECTFARFVKTAVFHRLPSRHVLCSPDKILRDLFTLYPFITNVKFAQDIDFESFYCRHLVFKYWKEAKSRFYCVTAKEIPLVKLSYERCHYLLNVFEYFPELAVDLSIISEDPRLSFISGQIYSFTGLGRNLRKITISTGAYDSTYCTNDICALVRLVNLTLIRIEIQKMINERVVMQFPCRSGSKNITRVELIYTGEGVALFPFYISRVPKSVSLHVGGNWLFAVGHDAMSAVEAQLAGCNVSVIDQ